MQEVKPSNLKIIQLDRTNVKVIGELKNVLIILSSNPKVHQIIDIIIFYIPEVYGLFLEEIGQNNCTIIFLQTGPTYGFLKMDSPTKSV
jgi:hypothetical protein